MANTISTQVIQNDGIYYAVRCMIIADGVTAETDTIIVDKSTLTNAATGAEPTALDLFEFYSSSTSVDGIWLEWDHGTDSLLMPVNQGAAWQKNWGLLSDPLTDGTGDVVLNYVQNQTVPTPSYFYACFKLRGRR